MKQPLGTVEGDRDGPVPAHRRELLWAALGDSFTAGSAPGEERWVDQVERRLSAGEVPVRLRNLAVPRARSADVARDQLGRALTLRPDVATVICGGNDVVLSVRPDLGAFEATLGGILGAIRSGLPGTAILTATYPNVSRFHGLRRRSRARIDRGIRAMNAAIRDLSARHGARCVELAGHADEEGDHRNYAADGFHPSATGHAKAARALAGAIADALGLEGTAAPSPGGP